ncbi:MAG TPA: endonuclease NucS domain-containing protein, partial [Leptolyngbyaceae cyanobacterium]
MAIIQVGEKWQFGSEFELEEVVWQSLPKLLNLKPFKRQFCVRGQFCDILALDNQQRLVVIELKNTEDRYVAQQLTRYYDALKEAAPFDQEIDIRHIRLIAIAPSFHQDTLIDCKYNLLRIELIS